MMNRETRVCLSVIIVIAGFLVMVNAAEKPDRILPAEAGSNVSLVKYTVTYSQDGEDYRVIIPPEHPVVVDVKGYACKLIREKVGDDLDPDYKDRVQIEAEEIDVPLVSD